MTAYKVHNQFFFLLDAAIEHAKNIIRGRYYTPQYQCNEQWKVTQGKKQGYCVAVLDDYWKVGNVNLLRVTIQTIQIQ